VIRLVGVANEWFWVDYYKDMFGEKVENVIRFLGVKKKH
jgi:hypothetical protein